jgi:hypothetical protein
VNELFRIVMIDDELQLIGSLVVNKYNVGTFFCNERTPVCRTIFSLSYSRQIRLVASLRQYSMSKKEIKGIKKMAHLLDRI